MKLLEEGKKLLEGEWRKSFGLFLAASRYLWSHDTPVHGFVQVIKKGYTSQDTFSGPSGIGRVIMITHLWNGRGTGRAKSSMGNQLVLIFAFFYGDWVCLGKTCLRIWNRTVWKIVIIVSCFLFFPGGHMGWRMPYFKFVFIKRYPWANQYFQIQSNQT